MSSSDKLKSLQEQVDALQESISRQFESISAVLSSIEAKLEASNSEMRAFVTQEVLSVYDASKQAVDTLGSNMREYIDHNLVIKSASTSSAPGPTENLANQYRFCQKKKSGFSSGYVSGYSPRFLVKSISNHLLILPVQLFVSGIRTITTVPALVDSGASANFVCSDFILNNGFPLQQTSEVIEYSLANNQKYTSNSISNLSMRISGTDHQEFLSFRHLASAAFPIILGMPWLTKHNANIHWRARLIDLTCLSRNYCPVGLSTPFGKRNGHRGFTSSSVPCSSSHSTSEHSVSGSYY